MIKLLRVPHHLVSQIHRCISGVRAEEKISYSNTLFKFKIYPDLAFSSDILNSIAKNATENSQAAAVTNLNISPCSDRSPVLHLS